MKKLITIVFATSLFVACLSLECSNTNPCPFTGGDILIQPEQIVSRNGHLAATLTVDIKEVQIEWLTLYRRSINNQIPSPTIRLKRGDTFIMRLVNNLTGDKESGPLNAYRFPNTTNIHLHGMHISPLSPHDNVLLEIGPGEENTYNYPIDPATSVGSYWYHPHVHGSVHFQVQGGMGGFFIVEDDDDDFPLHLRSVSCPHHCEHEVELVFQELLVFKQFFGIQHSIGDDYNFLLDHVQTTAGVSLEEYLEENVNIITTNGQVEPVLDILTGQTKRFRLLNAGGKETLALQIVNEFGNRAESCEVLEIANDGVYYDEARPQYFGHTVMSSGRRAEWLVNCRAPGTFELRSVPPTSNKSYGSASFYDGILLTIRVHGSYYHVNVPTSLPKRPYYMDDLTDVSPDEIGGRFMIELSGEHYLNRELFSGVHYRHRAKVGSIQEWIITNAGIKVSHPLHIHVNAFQIISYNKYTGPYAISEIFDRVPETVLFSQSHQQCDQQNSNFTGTQYPPPTSDPLKFLGHDIRYKEGLFFENEDSSGYAYGHPYRDTILVPPLSNITIRFRQHKYEGPVVIHCHILYHEDTGMMMVTDSVAEDDYDLEDVHYDTYGVYPGQCDKCDAKYPFHDIPLPSECYSKQ